MKEIAMYVFSATGNTMRCAALMKDALEQEGCFVTLQRVEDGTEEIAPARFYVICYPVHAFNAPANMIRFCENLPRGRAEVYFLKSQGEPLGTNNRSSREMIRRVRRRGMRYMGEFRYVMPYNIMFRHTDEIASKMLQVARLRIPEDARTIAEGKKHKLHAPLNARVFSPLLGFIHPAMRFNGRFFHVNAARCTACMDCVEHCPMKNIRFENGSFTFGRQCLGCMRCAFQCRTDAIRIGLIDFMRVNGSYDFERDPDKAVIGRYCHRAYARYFKKGGK